MAWKTPKTDWIAADVPLPKDFNRIEGNTLDNHERLNGHDSELSNHDSRISSNENRLDNIENGTTKVPEASYADYAARAKNLLSGLRNVSVIMGTISSGNTLPLPSGFSESECFWIVSINSLDISVLGGGDVLTRTRCYVDGSRTVHITATRYGDSIAGTANYLVIGVKK